MGTSNENCAAAAAAAGNAASTSTTIDIIKLLLGPFSYLGSCMLPRNCFVVKPILQLSQVAAATKSCKPALFPKRIKKEAIS